MNVGLNIVLNGCFVALPSPVDLSTFLHHSFDFIELQYAVVVHVIFLEDTFNVIFELWLAHFHGALGRVGYSALIVLLFTFVVLFGSTASH
jgi:hypothetical protein